MAQKIASNGSMLQNGKNVLIRTVTFFQVGRIERVTRSWVYLRDASWVGDTGRFGACLANGTFSEVEKILVECRLRTAEPRRDRRHFRVEPRAAELDEVAGCQRVSERSRIAPAHPRSFV